MAITHIYLVCYNEIINNMRSAAPRRRYIEYPGIVGKMDVKAVEQMIAEEVRKELADGNPDVLETMKLEIEVLSIFLLQV
jgi:hypothetical protein